MGKTMVTIIFQTGQERELPRGGSHPGEGAIQRRQPPGEGSHPGKGATLKLIWQQPFYVLFHSIIPRLLRFVNTLLCVYYFFAVIGMESFAGELPRELGPAPTRCSFWIFKSFQLHTVQSCSSLSLSVAHYRLLSSSLLSLMTTMTIVNNHLSSASWQQWPLLITVIML